MAHAYEHNPADHEDPVAGTTWMVAIIFAVAIVVTLLALTAVLYDVQDEETAVKQVAPESLELEALRARQMEKLTGEPRRVEELLENDELAVAVVIPIERAMQLVAEEH